MAYINNVIRSVEGATIDVSKRKRTVRACWSTDEGDHYRTAFVQSGIDTSAFDNNRIIGWEHFKSPQRATLPIANAVEYGVERYKGKNALIGASRFWEDEFADARFEDYASGRLKGWSINVLPVFQRAPTQAERRARPDWADLETVFESTRLLEVSATSLPGNPSTLTLSVERGLAGTHRFVMTRAKLEQYAGAYLQLRREHERATVGWHIVRGAIVDYASMKKLSVEDLQKEVARLELMCKLCELMGKFEEKEKWAAEADRVEAQKQAMSGRK